MNKLVRKNKKGFTLTEMIVVIAIIGILAAVMIPSVVIYVGKAKESAAYQEATGVYDVYEAYRTELESGLIELDTSDAVANYKDDGVFEDFKDYYKAMTGKDFPSSMDINETTHVLTYGEGKTIEPAK